MLGFSLGKLILIAIVAFAVWYGFRWFARGARLRRERDEAPAQIAPRAPAADGAEDMVRCAVCDSYVTARGARHCGRDGCPYPR